MTDSRPIAVFDSGVGGLSILASIRKLLPSEEILYFADQAHIPYGPRSLDEVALFSKGITRFLLDLNAKLIVVACNTASAAALQMLRQDFPAVPFVGMEPAVKPATEVTRNGHIGVLATPATFQGQLFASLVERFGEGLDILQATAPGLVEQIESGNLTGVATRQILVDAVGPLQDAGIDTLVLGCTHYPFIIPLLEDILGSKVTVIDPAPAVARQTARLLEAHTLHGPLDRAGRVTYLSSSDAFRLASVAGHLIGESGEWHAAAWSDRASLTLAS
jgi:glutamate racemase